MSQECKKKFRKKSGNQQKAKNEKINIQNYSGISRKNQEIKKFKKTKKKQQSEITQDL